MNAALRQLVRERAAGRCEYCAVTQDADPFYRFHIEHILPRQHGGTDAPDNLALACHHCNLHKGPNLTAIDPMSGTICRLFDPRTQLWDEHFLVRGGAILGLSPPGRATAGLLRMNAPHRIRIRAGSTH